MDLPGRRVICRDDLKGLPGLRRAAVDAILALQPRTVLEALLIPGVARKTTRFLLENELLVDPQSVQRGFKYDALNDLDVESRKALLNKVTKYLCRLE